MPGTHSLPRSAQGRALAVLARSRRYLGGVPEVDPQPGPQAQSGAPSRPAEGAEREEPYRSSDRLDNSGYDDFEGDFDDLEPGEDGEPVETVDELGRRHIRRAAPEGTDQILEHEAPRQTGLPDRLERWRTKTATGTVLTAFAMGLQQVFEPERNQPAIIMETSGEPPEDLPVEAQLEQLGPRQSSVTVRSWLLANNLKSAGNPPVTGEAATQSSPREDAANAESNAERGTGDR